MVFVVALFVIAQNVNITKCPYTEELLNNLYPVVHIVEYYSPMKREKLQTWSNSDSLPKSSGCEELKGHAAWDNRYDNLRRDWGRGLWLPLATGIWRTGYVWRSENHLWEWVPPSALWVPGIELRSPGLAAGAFSHRAILTAPYFLFPPAHRSLCGIFIHFYVG